MVYIDLGRGDQMVLGMKFAVYGHDEGIPVDGRAKAQIQVVSIFKNSSECEVMTVQPGRFLIPGETGTPPEGASDLVILLHPGYQRGIEPVWFPKHYLVAVEAGFTTDYQDPVLSLSDESAQQYEGRWAVSFAPVADSRFVVLIQQRYAPAVPWEVWFLVTLILIAIFLTLAIRYVYRISRPSESYE